MKKVALAEVKDHLSQYLREAGKERIVITRHGRPAGVLIGFKDEDDWCEYKLENDPRFLKRVAEARASIQSGKGVSWEDVQAEDDCRGGLHFFVTSAVAPSPLLDKYRSDLQSNGWSVETFDPGVGFGGNLSASKDGRFLFMNAGGPSTTFIDLCVWPSHPGNTQCDQDCQ